MKELVTTGDGEYLRTVEKTRRSAAGELLAAPIANARAATASAAESVPDCGLDLFESSRSTPKFKHSINGSLIIIGVILK